MKTPRNIIFFQAESYDGRMLGNMGHPALQNATPNLDRIAQSGTQFDQTYCSHPICCPSRANMWSGRYTHHCESWNNFKGLETQMWSLLGELPKTHTLKTYGKLDYLSGGHTLLARLSSWLAPAGIAHPVFDNDDHCQIIQVDDNEEMRCHEGDWQKVDQAIQFLKEGRDPDQPFFVYIGSGLVHAAFRTNRYWLDKIPDDAVDIPAMDPCDHPVRKHQMLAKAWRYGTDEETVRLVRRIYMAMCAETDHLVGRLYGAMQEAGLADTTYFVFGSDHGEMALEHQDWYKMTMYEGSVRVPLILSGPDIQAGQRITHPVSLIDVCPTLMEMAGLPRREGLDGESLMPLACGRTKDNRGWAYACFTGCTVNTSVYMFRKECWKYIAYVGYEPQLFDVESDPQELHDVSREHPDLVADLDRQLREVVDYEQTHRDWEDYCKTSFRQWRRQARRGLYVDNKYSLKDNPSSDYWTIMDNCFTGYNQQDEETVLRWLGGNGA